jgi:predicted negative regulator of RcsB-dependent stress response
VANKYTKKGRARGDLPAEGLAVDDEFISLTERVWIAIEPYLLQIGYGIAGLGVAALALWGLSSMWTGSRQDATEMFGKAVRVYEADLLGAEEKPKADDDVPRFKTSKERADATLAELDKLDKAHGSTKVSKQGRALRASVLFDQGKFAEAADLWRKVADDADKTDPMKVVAREGVGLCLESQGKLDDALNLFKEIEGAGGGFFKDRAQLDQARVLTAKGSKADAQKLYKDLLGRVPQGGLHDEIQSRLSALDG